MADRQTTLECEPVRALDEDDWEALQGTNLYGVMLRNRLRVRLTDRLSQYEIDIGHADRVAKEVIEVVARTTRDLFYVQIRSENFTIDIYLLNRSDAAALRLALNDRQVDTGRKDTDEAARPHPNTSSNPYWSPRSPSYGSPGSYRG